MSIKYADPIAFELTKQINDLRIATLDASRSDGMTLAKKLAFKKAADAMHDAALVLMSIDE